LSVLGTALEVHQSLPSVQKWAGLQDYHPLWSTTQSLPASLPSFHLLSTPSLKSWLCNWLGFFGEGPYWLAATSRNSIVLGYARVQTCCCIVFDYYILESFSLSLNPHC